MRVKLVNVERRSRSGYDTRPTYSAQIEIAGQHLGYVQRRKGGDYLAYSAGRQIAGADNLRDLKADIAEYVRDEMPLEDGGR